MADREIIVRDQHHAQSYIDALVKFLYVRTGFNCEEFVAPQHLQRLIDDMSFNRVPLTVWNGLLSSALRIVNMSRTVGHGLRQFGAFFVDVLVWLARKLVRLSLLQLAVFLYSWLVNPIARVALVVLYYAIDYLLKPLWQELSLFIQKRLISAPYYCQFVTMA